MPLLTLIVSLCLAKQAQTLCQNDHVSNINTYHYITTCIQTYDIARMQKVRIDGLYVFKVDLFKAMLLDVVHWSVYRKV